MSKTIPMADIKSGQTIGVQIASALKEGKWTNHSRKEYIVEGSTKNSISCRNADNDHECLNITQKSIDEGFLIIEEAGK